LVLRSDEIRKRQHGMAPEQRLPPTAYTEQISTAVFSELANLVQIASKGGHAAIADATFMDFVHRAKVEAAAASACVPFLGIWLSAPLAVLEQRIAARTGDASDATVDVLHAAAANDPGPAGWHAIDASDGAMAESAVLTLVEGLAKSHIVF
jgi:hypothetical protein